MDARTDHVPYLNMSGTTNQSTGEIGPVVRVHAALRFGKRKDMLNKQRGVFWTSSLVVPMCQGSHTVKKRQKVNRMAWKTKKFSVTALRRVLTFQ